MQYKNLGEFFDANAKKYADKTYLIFDKTGEKFTYKEFMEKVNQTANLLQSIGVKRKDTVSTYLPNMPAGLFLFFATAKLGAIINPMSPTLTKDEVEFQLDNADTNVFVYFADFKDSIGTVNGPKLDKKVVIGGKVKGTVDFDDELERHPGEFKPLKEVDMKDKWVMIYTSGTTGKPKGCLLSQFNLNSMTPSYIKASGFTEKDISLTVMPIIHVTGLIMTSYTSFHLGGTTVLTEKFSKSKFWKWVNKYKITFIEVVPTMLSILLNPPEDIKKYNLKSLRLIACGSAPLPLEVAKKFEETFGILIYEVYGLTETTHITHYNPVDPKKRILGSIGKPLEVNECAIHDEKDNDLPPKVVGELVMKGPNVMDGYHKRPEVNKEAFKKGWFHSGDLGYKDENGYYYLVDRKKDIIIRGAENVSPGEIDNVIYQFPAVHDAATIGVPDKIYGEEIESFVVVKDGIDIGKEDDDEKKEKLEKEIIEHCKKHLAKFKCPKKIYFIDEIPKGPSGKLLRKELRVMRERLAK